MKEMSYITRKLGTRLRKLRKYNCITLKTAAQKATISLSFLSDIERGVTNPSLETLMSLVGVYRTTLSALFYGLENGNVLTSSPKILPPGDCSWSSADTYSTIAQPGAFKTTRGILHQEGQEPAEETIRRIRDEEGTREHTS